MKKGILILLVIALLLGLVSVLSACGETEPKVAVQTEAPKATAAPKPAATAKPTATPKPTKAPKQTPAPTEEPALVVLEPTDPEQTDAPQERSAPQHDYVLNTSSKKFHYPTCSSVGDMKDKNKKEFTGTRDEVIAMGYDPCGKCKP